MSGLLQDLRYALRQLCKSPGLATVAVVTLALGIGANTAVFSTLNALLLKMLPVRDPENVYTVVLVNGGTQPPNTDGTGNGNTSFSFPVFEALRQQKRVFTDLIARVPLGFGKVPVRYGDTPTEKQGEEVSGNYFSGLGVRIWRGIGFTAADESNHNPVVVFELQLLDQSILSKSRRNWANSLYQKYSVHNHRRNRTGILWRATSAGGGFLDSLQTRPELNAWGVPATEQVLLSSTKWWALPMVARLQPGISPQQAEQALQPTFWQAATEPLGKLDFKTWPAHLGFEPIRGAGNYAESYREPVKIMMVLVGLVLLIACTNVVLLILARNAAREREFAVRMAVGADAFRMFRQLLTESLLLAAAGAALGWALAIAATKALAIWAELIPGLPRINACFSSRWS